MGENLTSCCGCRDRMDKITPEFQKIASKYGPKAAALMQKGNYVNLEGISDHNMYGKDDVPELTYMQLQNFDRFTQFEKHFPFYRMDVNGFIFHINEAINMYCESEGIITPHAKAHIDFVQYKYLKQEFSKYTSWKELNNPKSHLVLFLHKQKYDGELTGALKKDEIILDELRLKLLGVLLCKGDAIEKSQELFDAIVEG